MRSGALMQSNLSSQKKYFKKLALWHAYISGGSEASCVDVWRNALGQISFGNVALHPVVAKMELPQSRSQMGSQEQEQEQGREPGQGS